jgi:hypothetical protein
VAFEEAGCFVESLGGEQDVASEALDEAPAAGVPDRETDVVADDGGEERENSDEDDVEAAGAGVYRLRPRSALPIGLIEPNQSLSGNAAGAFRLTRFTATRA